MAKFRTLTREIIALFETVAIITAFALLWAGSCVTIAKRKKLLKLVGWYFFIILVSNHR
jgi:hypothetical protein